MGKELDWLPKRRVSRMKRQQKRINLIAGWNLILSESTIIK
jgi:hypothetical protein